MKNQPGLDQICINTLRPLSIDAVQKPPSGHPGMPMDVAPTADCLWQRFLRHDPADLCWPNRDRPHYASASSVAGEQAAAFGWERYPGMDGAIIGLHSFGISVSSRATS